MAGRIPQAFLDTLLDRLDIVEVVSCSMRELRVKVPRSELSKLTSIDGLVDLLERLHAILSGDQFDHHLSATLASLAGDAFNAVDFTRQELAYLRRNRLRC